MKNLDHLGIIAGIIDEIGIVEQLNQRLNIDSRKKVSTGVVVKAMLLNGLGLVSAPMYLFEKFFSGKATEELLGLGIKSEYLNDDRLGDVIEQYLQKSQQEMKRLSTQEFACIEDAINAAQKLSQKMRWHELSDIQTVEKRHYGKAGKPSKDRVPDRVSYRVMGIVRRIESEISTQNIRCGRFILATNILDSERLSADKALREYKAQQGVERGFRFLKDPLFFASSVFLKSPKRIAALGRYFYSIAVFSELVIGKVNRPKLSDKSKYRNE